MEPVEPIEELIEDSPAARGAPCGRTRGRGRGRVHRVASKTGSLSKPPLELAWMEGSEDQDVVLLCVSKVFYTLTYVK